MKGTEDMTNGDWIRSRSDDELAIYLHMIQAGAIIDGKADSEEILLDWLGEKADKEAEGGDF